MNFDEIKNTLINKADGAIVMSEVNRLYLTGFAATDGYFLITKDKTVLFMDSRYYEASLSKAESCDEVVLLKSLSDSVAPVLDSLGVKTLITESDRMTVSALRSLNKKLNRPVSSDIELDRAIDRLRSVKSQRELMLIKKAQAIAEAAFDNILTFIKPGVTEREIGLELDYYMLRHGADGLSFETIAVSGKNTSLPHGVPTDKRVEAGDFITMDYGAVCEGYHSDMTRTVALGFVTDKQLRVYNTVLEAQNAAFSVIRPGIKCSEVDMAARSVISDRGYGEYFGHGLGHGVGVEIHESPNLSPRSEDTLQKGNVVTNEPGIYIPQSFGVRIEDMVYVTEDGYENLTSCKKELIVL